VNKGSIFNHAYYFCVQQEQTAFAQYNEALAMLREENFEAGKAIFRTLLENSFLVEVGISDLLPYHMHFLKYSFVKWWFLCVQITKQDATEGLGHPAMVLKYSCLKNMGTLLERQGELQGALQHYLLVTTFVCSLPLNSDLSFSQIILTLGSGLLKSAGHKYQYWFHVSCM
jgi:hypothetical protein